MWLLWVPLIIGFLIAPFWFAGLIYTAVKALFSK